MKRVSFCRRLTALLLCLGLLAGLAIPAGAASTNPNAHLYDSGYWGDADLCRMDSDMAMAYAGVLDTLPAMNSYAILIDPAEDGLPLLITTYAKSSYLDDVDQQLKIWTWDGQNAVSYDIQKDLECGYAFGYTFGYYHGEAALQVGDGVGLAVGDASGYLYYRVTEGRLSLLRHEMLYSAYTEDGVTAWGNRLPLVQASKEDWGESASVAALLQAGWLRDSYGSSFSLAKENGQYLHFDNDQALSQWMEDNSRAFTPDPDLEFLEVSTGGTWLLGQWPTVSAMKTTLTCYARDYAVAEGAFVDVPKKHYAYEPVRWAVEEGITNGTGLATFSPEDTCTQGQILTFLWRAMGEPVPNAPVGGEYYAAACQWAKEQGIVTNEMLEPNAFCGRSDVVLYLWRLAGEPAAGGVSFSDVDAAAPYAAAVSWAVEEGVTNGTGADTFSPDSACTRGQIVTFLYRALK